MRPVRPATGRSRATNVHPMTTRLTRLSPTMTLAPRSRTRRSKPVTLPALLATLTDDPAGNINDTLDPGVDGTVCPPTSGPTTPTGTLHTLSALPSDRSKEARDFLHPLPPHRDDPGTRTQEQTAPPCDRGQAARPTGEIERIPSVHRPGHPSERPATTGHGTQPHSTSNVAPNPAQEPDPVGDRY
jgi:hypothetical protein